MRVYTVGHSTRPFPQLLELLTAHGVTQVADVRSYPGSRRHPQFSRFHLERSLPQAGLAYAWMGHLGGMRRPVAETSANAGWREPAFRAYADHMGTAHFAAACAALEAWAMQGPTVCLCAEAEALRCHRQLLADALLVRGWEVRHIESPQVARVHVLTPFAKLGADGGLTYPGHGQMSLPL
jgi:uncharacterized protein (DUF488 family)